jgi:TatD DNase family protein
MSGIDVHCHVVETIGTLSALPLINTKMLFLVTTKRSEWELVLPFSLSQVIAFGIHPWFSHLHKDQDLEIMRSYLTKYPDAFIGEIGIDKVAVDPKTNALYPFDRQLDLFKQQMDIAVAFERPVSIHSVHTHGDILDYFRNLDKSCGIFKKQKKQIPCPPAIMLHSYSGPLEIALQLLKLPRIGNRFYFSFSSIVNGRSSKTLRIINQLPDDRILLESDTNSVLDVDQRMEECIKLVGNAKNWTIEYTIESTTRNALRFLKFA